MRRTLTIILLAMAAALSTRAQEPHGNTPNTLRLPADAPRPKASVADLAWLAGRWTGEGLGGRIEETWSAPDAGSMVGYFRLVKDDKPVFYEIMTILEVDGSLQMRLKHVNPDMTGWEEKNDFVTFRLVKQDATGVWFDGLTFRRNGPDAMDGYLALRNRTTGAVSEERFSYRRARAK